MPETNPRELVERFLNDPDDRLHRFAAALSAALDREERLEADNTRLRLEVAESVSEEDYEKLLALRRVEIDANNACHEEITRLRGLLEEAKGVLGPFAEAVADTIGDDDPDDWAVDRDQGLSFADLRAASSLLKRLEGE